MSAPVERLGNYLLQAKLGQGGMGTVFLALQEGLRRRVALKVLPEKRIGKSPDLLKRFMREASVCARLSHPNIVKVFDYGFENGFYYYAMEVLPGRSVEDVLKEQAIQPVEYALRIARQMADAFSHFHPLGIIHRDIKPANILLDESGKAILTDFGLVKDLEASGITRVGIAVGTPFYMAPEAIRGMLIGPGADIYGLGVVLYRMLTGRYPFPGQNSQEVFQKILHAEAEPISALNPAVPAPVENVVVNCLEKDPKVRYETAEQLAADLSAASRRQRVHRRRDGPAPADGQTTGPIPSASRKAAAGPANAEPATPARKPSSRTLRTATVQAAGGRPGATVTGPIATVPAPERASRRVVAGVVALTLAVVAVVAFLALRGGYEAMEVQVRVGARRALFDWQSRRAYAGTVEWGQEQQSQRATVVETAETTRHAVTLEPLKADCDYTARVVLPDGTRSLEHTFRCRPFQPAPRGLTVTADRIELAFDTAEPALVTLQTGPCTVVEPKPTTTHSLVAGPCRPLDDELALSIADATGEPQTLDRTGVVRIFRQALLPALAAELVRAMRDYDPRPFIEKQLDRELPTSVCTGAVIQIHSSGVARLLDGVTAGPKVCYLSFAPSDPLARRMAGLMEAHFTGQPFASQLAAFAFLAPGAFDDRVLSPETALETLEALRKVDDLDFYAAFIRIPFETGLRKVFRRDYVMRSQMQLQSQQQPLVETIFPPRAWACPEVDWKAAQRLTSLGGERQDKYTASHDWSFVLRDPSRWKSAELDLLNLQMDSELIFQATINGKLRLDYRDPLPMVGEGRRPEFPVRSMTFDPRYLRSGVNHIRVVLTPTPGTRYLGLRRTNGLAALRLAWE